MAPCGPDSSSPTCLPPPNSPTVRDNGAQSLLGVRFGEASKDLPLPVETMARGEAQAELVAGYLRGLKCGGAVAAAAWRAKNSAASV